MKTITVELSSIKALKLLKDLEDLNLLRILSSEKAARLRLSEKYAGKLSVDVAEKLQRQIGIEREEWNRDI